MSGGTAGDTLGCVMSTGGRAGVRPWDVSCQQVVQLVTDPGVCHVKRDVSHQDKPASHLAGCDRLRQDATGSDRARQGMTGYDRLQRGATGYDRLRQGATDCDRLRQATIGCNITTQFFTLRQSVSL